MSLYGYSGLSTNVEDKISANYLVTNNNRYELNIFILVPGSQEELVKIAKHIHYSRVNIFIPSIEDRFLNTAFGLYKEIYLLKKTQCVFPHRPPKDFITNISFETNFNTCKKYISPYSDISVEYKYVTPEIVGEDETLEFYNWIIRTNDRNIILTSHMSLDNLIAWYSDNSIDEIHMEYNDSLFGGLTYKQLVETYPLYNKFKNRLHVNRFLNEDELNEAKKLVARNRVCIGFSVPNMF